MDELRVFGGSLVGKSLGYYNALLGVVRSGGTAVLVALNLAAAKEKFCRLCDCEAELDFEPAGDGHSWIITLKNQEHERNQVL